MWIAAIIFCTLTFLISMISIKIPFLKELLAKFFLTILAKHPMFDVYGEVLQAVLEVNQYSGGVSDGQMAVLLINALLDAMLMGSINFVFRASFGSVSKKGVISWANGPVITVVSVGLGLLLSAGRKILPLSLGTIFTVAVYIGCICLGIGMLLRWHRNEHYKRKDRNGFHNKIVSAVSNILMGSVSSMACLAIITNTLLGPSLIRDSKDFGDWIIFYVTILGLWGVTELLLWLKFSGYNKE